MEAEVEEQTEFKLSELSPKARARAIERHSLKRGSWWDENDWGCVHEEAAQYLGWLGFEVETDVHAQLRVHWQGFCSQGDGLVFAATWRAADMQVHKLMEEVGDIESSDEDLREIAARLLAVFLRYPNARVRITIQHHGAGLGWMAYENVELDTEDTDDEGEDGDALIQLGEEVLACAKDLASWWYGQLEANYEWFCSEEATIEDIEARELIFNEEGDEQ